MLGQFETALRSSLATARQWEIPEKKRKALSAVPLDDLQAIAEAKFDSSVSSEELPNSTRSGVLRDLLLLELLNWFKTEFFTWTDAPKCPKCEIVTTSVSGATPTPSELIKGANRIELYKCPKRSCGEMVRFPRYNDPAVLLETRTGRCGEWANCFGLICRAVGFETRYIYDFTDHVWVEVFSSGMTPKNRWLHCDPCENTCDNPLLYEVGWGKKLTFVIGASIDDIQDVTWRYTHPKNLKELLVRRNCSEQKVAEAVVQERKQIQALLPVSRKNILDQRLVEELVEFIIPKSEQVKQSEMQGRQSGSLAWRLARQEVHEQDQPARNGYEWQISSASSGSTNFELTYDPVTDCYRNSSNSNILRGWRNGTFYVENIFRKEEKDWKMVYLARQESSNGNNFKGKIAWKFTIPSSSSKIQISKINLEMFTQIFEKSARVQIIIADDANQQLQIPESCCQDGHWKWEKDLTSGVRSVLISVELLGGHGALAWQHAQLFRASTAHDFSSVPKKPSFRLLITFSN
ncbi:unnamed protein product [Allacma fusca]|uniref:PAW domain-containing protein n=1 Tax=Allacma fusca TaxID=39272 RepID=A0A8J2K6H4_9HEXA|nr:unnamed protein product [Allacma fusca]